MCKYKFQEFFLRKTQYQEYFLIEYFETSRKLLEYKNMNNKKIKKNKIKQITNNMIDTWTFKILIKKIKNLALLFIVF